MSLHRVSDIVEASRVRGIPDSRGDTTNGNTLRVIHSLPRGLDPALNEFDMVCYSLHGGSPHHAPRLLRKRLSLNDDKSPYKDYFNIERDHGANEMAEAFVEAMRRLRRNVLCVIVRLPRGAADCNRCPAAALSLEFSSKRISAMVRRTHAQTIEVLFDVQHATQNRRVATVDFHTMAPGSTDGIDNERRIRARQRGRQRRPLGKNDLAEHARVWCESSLYGKHRPFAVLYKDPDGNHIGDHEFAMAVKSAYRDDGITVAIDDPYYSNPTYPGAQLIRGDGFHFEATKDKVCKKQSGPFDLIQCEGDIHKARAVVQRLVQVSSRVIDQRTA